MICRWKNGTHGLNLKIMSRYGNGYTKLGSDLICLLIVSQILHMGTIHELLPANAHYKVWQRKALVVTNGHLNIFSSLPVSG